MNLLALAAAVGPVLAVLAYRYTDRDARILRARRRDVRRLQHGRARVETVRRGKLRRAARGEHVGQVKVRNAPPLPVRDAVPPPPARGTR